MSDLSIAAIERAIFDIQLLRSGNMQIKVVSVSEPQVQSTQGGKQYKIFELEYEANGKTSTRKIVNWKDEYDGLVAASPGQLYTVNAKKNGKFYDWTDVQIATDSGNGEDKGSNSSGHVDEPTRYAKRPSSSFETPEERAARQELIVRQSSITAALTFLGANSKDDLGITVEQVLEHAKRFRDFVYGVELTVTPRAD